MSCEYTPRAALRVWVLQPSRSRSNSIHHISHGFSPLTGFPSSPISYPRSQFPLRTIQSDISFAKTGLPAHYAMLTLGSPGQGPSTPHPRYVERFRSHTWMSVPRSEYTPCDVQRQTSMLKKAVSAPSPKVAHLMFRG